MRPLSPRNVRPKRITLRHLICDGLGYCCEWAFWSYFKMPRHTPLIAERLGVTERAVQKRRAAWRRKELRCEACAKCMRFNPLQPKAPLPPTGKL
jgi:hypothetical protein